MRVDRSTNQAAYTSPISGIDAQRMRTRHFAPDKAQGQKFFALTSYDALTADIFDEAGTDLLLVGNSAAYDGIELRNKGASEDFISRLPTCTPDEIGYSPW